MNVRFYLSYDIKVTLKSHFTVKTLYWFIDFIAWHYFTLRRDVIWKQQFHCNCLSSKKHILQALKLIWIYIQFGYKWFYHLRDQIVIWPKSFSYAQNLLCLNIFFFCWCFTCSCHLTFFLWQMKQFKEKSWGLKIIETIAIVKSLLPILLTLPLSYQYLKVTLPTA